MLIQHADKSTATIGHPTYGPFEAIAADEGGVFNVPDDLADELLHFRHLWHEYTPPRVRRNAASAAVGGR